MWIQTGVTVRKWLSWVVTSVTLTFDLWPWPFAWTLRWSLVITPENFMMIRWWQHSQQGKSEGFESCDRSIVRKRPILGQNRWCFVPCDLEIWWMTLENNRASPLGCFKLCASFHSHLWIQTGVTVRKRPIWVKFDEFWSRVTLKFDGWPWTRQIWGIWKLRLAYSPETPNLGQNWWCFVPCDLEIWRMTLENDRASLLYCFQLCATFHSHWWIQTGLTVQKRPFWVKFDDF